MDQADEAQTVAIVTIAKESLNVGQHISYVVAHFPLRVPGPWLAPSEPRQPLRIRGNLLFELRLWLEWKLRRASGRSAHVNSLNLSADSPMPG
jgi:hypothetical protein